MVKAKTDAAPVYMAIIQTLITMKPLTARLGVTRHCVYKWVRNNKFPKPLKPNGPMGHAYWRVEDVAKWEAGKWSND